MRTLELVPPGQHTADDLQFLLDADTAQPLIERIPLLQVDHGLRMGRLLLFRVHPGPGNILAEVMSDNGVKRLEIVRASGRVGVSMRKILASLWAYGQELGCECVTTVVYSDRLQKMLSLSGAHVEGWILTFPERSHGHQEKEHHENQPDHGAEAA